MTLIILFLFVWLPACFVAGDIAEDKGHSFFKWAVAAFFFGPVGLLGAVGLSDKKQRRILKQIAETPQLEAE